MRFLARQAGSGGQALPEFALIVPAFFLMLFGVIQMGFTLSGYIGQTNATRETARYAVTLPTATTAQILSELTSRQLPKAIPGFRAANVVVGGTGSAVIYCAAPNPNNVAGYASYSIHVRVTAVYRQPLLIPFVGIVVDAIDGSSDNALTTRVVEEMRVESPRLTSGGGLPAC